MTQISLDVNTANLHTVHVDQTHGKTLAQDTGDTVTQNVRAPLYVVQAAASRAIQDRCRKSQVWVRAVCEYLGIEPPPLNSSSVGEDE